MVAASGLADSCLEQRGAFDLDDGRLLGASLGGLVLLQDGEQQGLTVARIGVDDQIESLAEIATSANGLVAHDPDGSRVLVLEQPDRLHRFGSDGQPISSALLGAPSISATRELIVVEDDVVRAIAVFVAGSEPLSTELWLERRRPNGDLRWSRRVAELDLDGFEVDQVRSLGLSAGVLALLAYDWGIDSAAVELAALDPDTGALRWHRRLTDDDFLGPQFALASAEDQLFLGEVHRDPSRLVLQAIDKDGTTTWDGSYTDPQLVGVNLELAVVGGEVLAHVRSIDPTQDEFSTFALLLRVDLVGDESCWTRVAGHSSSNTNLFAIGGGRAVLDVPANPDSDASTRVLLFGDGLGGCVDLP